MALHIHNYRVVNRSQVNTGNGLKWIERCRCGFNVSVEHEYSLNSGNTQTRGAKIKKTWFDRRGDIIQVTGNSDDKPITSNQ